MTETTEAMAVKWFNSEYPIGTAVTAWPGARPEGRTVEGTTRTPAWLVGGVPCVSVTGLAGGIALSHVEVHV